MITKTIVATKAVSAGGLSALLMNYYNDAEFVILLVTGLFASVTSFIYDLVHRETVRFGFKEFTELIKYIFYGIPVMVIIFYYATLNLQDIADVPVTVWGFVSMLCAGSAVSIVEFFAPIFGNIGKALLNRAGGVK